MKQIEQACATGRIAFGVSGFYVSPLGNLDKSVRMSSQIQMDLDFLINRLYLSLFFNGTLSAKNKIPVFSSNRHQWLDLGSRVSLLNYGVKVGKKFDASPRINYYPYLSIRGCNLSDLTDPDKNNQSLVSSFFAGAGVSGELLLFKWESKNQVFINTSNLLYLKVDCGFRQNLTGKVLKGTQPYVGIGINWGFGRF
ncbi:MAG: hypothetical protein Q8862_01860 [Bacteroidota bacterium]|nr:hypothetical protein [Bacteroidota bacterium]